MRFAIWKARRRAKLISRYTGSELILAKVNDIAVGTFRRGHEVKRDPR